MDSRPWSALMSRIVPRDASDLDALTAGLDARCAAVPGRDAFPDLPTAAHPQGAFKRPDTVCVGVRVREPLADAADAADRAMRLASLAEEQDLEVVVLAHVDVTGLERFGFRIERIAGDTPEAQAQCERQVVAFWSIDLVL